jgi:hypothetical protein
MKTAGREGKRSLLHSESLSPVFAPLNRSTATAFMEKQAMTPYKAGSTLIFARSTAVGRANSMPMELQHECQMRLTGKGERH